MTFSPWQTSARFTPVSGITSHTVASATRSSSADQVRLLARVRRTPAGAACAPSRPRSGTPPPAAHSDRQPGGAVQPVRIDRGEDRRRRALGLVVVQHDRCRRRRRAADRASAAAVPQSTQTISRAPRAHQRHAAPDRSGRSPPSCGPARGAAPSQPSRAQPASPSARRCTRHRRRNRRTRRPSRRCRTASASRSAAASMSISTDGSGSSARSVGSRKSPPPRSRRRARPAGGRRSPARPAAGRCRDAMRSSPVRQTQRRPLRPRSTPHDRVRGAQVGQPAGSTAPPTRSSGAEVVVRLDVAHGAGLAAHHHRMGDRATAEALHAAQHGAGA